MHASKQKCEKLFEVLFFEAFQANFFQTWEVRWSFRREPRHINLYLLGVWEVGDVRLTIVLPCAEPIRLDDIQRDDIIINRKRHFIHFITAV